MDGATAIERVLGHEGGYVSPEKAASIGDPGGETNWGITKRSYPNVDIAALTRDQAKEIYLRDFWNRINADKLYDGVAYQMLDFAVNSGIDTSVRYLQRALGVADDGHWGPVSQAAADAMSESDQIMRTNGVRLDFMTRRKNWADPSTSKSWARRIARNLMYGADDS